jgi:hypothetical protein
MSTTSKRSPDEWALAQGALTRARGALARAQSRAWRADLAVAGHGMTRMNADMAVNLHPIGCKRCGRGLCYCFTAGQLHQRREANKARRAELLIAQAEAHRQVTLAQQALEAALSTA